MDKCHSKSGVSNLANLDPESWLLISQRFIILQIKYTIKSLKQDLNNGHTRINVTCLLLRYNESQRVVPSIPGPKIYHISMVNLISDFTLNFGLLTKCIFDCPLKIWFGSEM